MYTSFITLSDIDNRRRNTIRFNNEASKTLTFDTLKQAIRERNMDNFNKELNNTILEMFIDKELSDTYLDKLLYIVKEGSNIGMKINGDVFIPLVSNFTSINKLTNMLKKSNVTITESLSNEILKNKISSRILNNYNIIKEELGSEFNPKATDDYIISFCESFDNKFTNMKDSKKFIVCIETLSYIFDKNNVEYMTEDLINTVTDYFIFSKDNRKNYKNIYDEMVSNLKVLYNETKGFNTDKNKIYLLESETFANSDDVSQAIKDFKKDTNKSYSVLKQIILKLYTKSPAMIIDEMPNVLSLLRYLVILGGTGINPLLGLVALCVDKFIHLKLSREYTEKMFNHFKKEKEKTEKKLEKLDSNGKKYKDTESYSKCLDRCIEKIEEYKSGLYSEKELYGSDDDDYESKDNNDDNGFDFDDDSSDDDGDFDFSFDECCTDLVPVDNKSSITAEELVENINRYLDNDILAAQNEFRRIVINTTNMMNYLKTIDDIHTNLNSGLFNNLTASNEFSICIGECLPKTDDDRLQLDNFKEIANAETEYFFVYFTCPIVGGWVSINLRCPSYTILPTIEDDEFHENHSIMPQDLELMSYILAIDESVSELEDFEIVNSKDYLKQNMNKIIESSPMVVSDIIANMKDIVDIEEYTSMLKDVRNKNKDSIINTDISCAIGILEDVSDLGLNVLNTLEVQKESAKLMEDVIHEKFDLASLKVAKINLGNKIKQLGNKEKEISRNFDLSMTKVKDGLEKAMTNDRREAIIKGSIIPSASKCVKLAITTGAAFLINPALAIIGCIGGLAVSKGLNKRERAILLDEIEVELKVVEKEISMAEGDGDTAKYRRLLMYQNKLRKEGQRIRYHIRSAGYNNTVGIAKGKDED